LFRPFLGLPSQCSSPKTTIIILFFMSRPDAF
jgi:hypothetical protein